jgi:hypothetical protein
MNVGLVVFVLAVVVVLATSLFKTVDLSTKVKSLIAIVLSVVAGSVTVWVSQGGDFSTANVVQSVALVYAASQVMYDFIFKGTKIDNVLTSIGGSTDATTGA